MAVPLAASKRRSWTCRSEKDGLSSIQAMANESPSLATRGSRSRLAASAAARWSVASTAVPLALNRR